MSQPTRADRRRQARGSGPSAPKPHRDPMVPIYIGVGVLFLLIVAGFGIFRWQQNQQIAAAGATPSPGPSPIGKPVQLADGGSLGAPHFKIGNTPAGGHGQAVDGITCLSQEGANLHIHTHLALLNDGKLIQIPRFIGFASNPTLPGGGCLYWIHTHDASGIIHVESPEILPPAGGSHYTLGMLFDIWGEPLGNDGVAGFKGPVTAYVNGAKYDGDLKDIPLMSHQQVVLEIGKVVPPPAYVFPPND
jgi:hypothetical protein